MKRRDFNRAVAGIAAGVVAGTKVFADDKKAPAKAAQTAEKAPKHVCKGKNACKGQGGCAVSGKHDCAGKNECKGQGGCATEAKHDCAGKNECKGQGGCKTGDAGCAGKNTCKGKGGCAVPVHQADPAPAPKK